MRDGYPINILSRVREVPEVCAIYCATANPVEVIVAETEQGRGILGVIDGSSPKGVESDTDVEWRRSLLRKIGYKKYGGPPVRGRPPGRLSALAPQGADGCVGCGPGGPRY